MSDETYTYGFNFDDPMAILTVGAHQTGFEKVLAKYPDTKPVTAHVGAILAVEFPKEPAPEVMEDIKKIMLDEWNAYIAEK